MTQLPDHPVEIQQVADLLAHKYIREREKGVAQAAALLADGQFREFVRALLERVAQHDSKVIVREAAQAALDADAKRTQPRQRPDESRHIFSAVCKNEHVSYFDKRRVCPPSGAVMRGKEQLDEITLKCTTCGEELVVSVDCEGYR